MKWREGQKVQATRTVTENGGQGREKSKFPQASYIHARKGELGTVVDTNEPYPTVRFDRTGTATIVRDDEIEPLRCEVVYNGPSDPNLHGTRCERERGHAISFKPWPGKGHTAKGISWYTSEEKARLKSLAQVDPNEQEQVLRPSPAPAGCEKEVARLNETRGVVCTSFQCRDTICIAWWKRYARLPDNAREAIGNVMETHK